MPNTLRLHFNSIRLIGALLIEWINTFTLKFLYQSLFQYYLYRATTYFSCHFNDPRFAVAFQPHISTFLQNIESYVDIALEICSREFDLIGWAYDCMYLLEVYLIIRKLSVKLHWNSIKCLASLFVYQIRIWTFYCNLYTKWVDHSIQSGRFLQCVVNLLDFIIYSY
jgi:hypothetical protein